ncbi:MAG TPA: hypothetical protein VH062_34110 [Polyangiaceae bacterium]|jgi:hypothetical protein|nr:hypothetical protein [Polyangiaceae bacterium]
MIEAAQVRLRRLLQEFQNGTMDVEPFCTQFEHTYNLELDKRTLSPAEAQAFGELFEEVIWYSPSPEERAKIQNYRGDAEIREAADRAAKRLSAEPPS